MESLFTKEQIDDLYKLPDSFPIEAFSNKLILTFNMIADFAEDDNLANWRHEFMLNVLKSFATSDYFTELKPTIKAEMMDQWDSLRHVLDVLRDLYTAEVSNNSAALGKYLLRKLTVKND